MGRREPDRAGKHVARHGDAGNLRRPGTAGVDVPDGQERLGELVREEAEARNDRRYPDLRRLEADELDLQDVPWLRPQTAIGPVSGCPRPRSSCRTSSAVLAARQLTVDPVSGLERDRRPGLDRRDRLDFRVPAVVTAAGLCGQRASRVDGDPHPQILADDPRRAPIPQPQEEESVEGAEGQVVKFRRIQRRPAERGSGDSAKAEGGALFRLDDEQLAELSGVQFSLSSPRPYVLPSGS